MRFLSAVILVSVLAASSRADSIDGRVVQVQLPAQDVTLYYIESKGGFTVKLESGASSVEGQKLYIGDGEAAVELVAHPTDGIFLQGVKYRQGDQFKKGSTIKIGPGHKKAAELRPGDVYVVLPGVSFELAGR